MFSTKSFVPVAAIIAFYCTAAIGQQKSTAASSRGLREFPVVLQQSVEAGKTPVGTKVQGKLAIATLFHGIVIPRDAVVSGVIFESVAKSANAPSRLGIRMESAKWKNQSTCMMKAYLMPLYYPMTAQSMQGPPNASPDLDSRSLNGPNQSGSSPMSSPSFSGGNSEALQGTIPDIPTISSRPVSMKNVVMEPKDEGGIELVSEHANIKLNKMTTYILAALEEPPAK
jgi:hypothetical protein